MSRADDSPGEADSTEIVIRVRPQTIRVIDRTVGKAICAGLSAVRDKKPAPSGVPRRILFLKLIEQGATVLAWDAVRNRPHTPLHF